MVDDLIRLYDKDAKPKTIKTKSDKKSTTVLKGSDAENWMISSWTKSNPVVSVSKISILS